MYAENLSRLYCIFVFETALHEEWFRILTYTFLILTMVSGQIITMAYNVKEEQGGGRTEDSKFELVDLGQWSNVSR